MSSKTRMKELIRILNEAGKAYYQENREIMSNYEYDKLYDELAALEKDGKIAITPYQDPENDTKPTYKTQWSIHPRSPPSTPCRSPPSICGIAPGVPYRLFSLAASSE